jgi:hypothetical protein
MPNEEVRLYMVGYDLAKPNSMSDAVYEAKLNAIKEFVHGPSFLEAKDIVKSTWFVTTSKLHSESIRDLIVEAIEAKRVNNKPLTMDTKDRILVIRLWPHDPSAVMGFQVPDAWWLRKKINLSKK